MKFKKLALLTIHLIKLVKNLTKNCLYWYKIATIHLRIVLRLCLLVFNFLYQQVLVPIQSHSYGPVCLLDTCSSLLKFSRETKLVAFWLQKNDVKHFGKVVFIKKWLDGVLKKWGVENDMSQGYIET